MQKQTYTIHPSEQDFLLHNVSSDEVLTIEPTHPKFNYVKENQGRVININEKGRFNSSEDRHDYYGTSTKSNNPTPNRAPINITLTKLDDLYIDDSLFVPLQTGTIVDKFLSTEGGFLPGTNVMLVGMPGTGKTTVGVELISKLHEQGKKVLFISAEMNQIDMSRYLKRFPNWGSVPMLFMSDYTENSSKEVIETVLEEGWDLIFTDSFSEVCDQVKEDTNMSRGSVEKWFLQLMDKHNTANNKSKIYTTFLTILQVGKSGVFSGSNKLKHMSSAMMHLEWEGSENSGKRFMYFSKNRVGKVGKKLFYDLKDGVQFNEARFTRDLFNDEVLEEERKQLDSEGSAFDKLFGFSENGIPEELKTSLEL